MRKLLNRWRMEIVSWRKKRILDFWENIEHENISKLARVLRGLLWTDRETRERIQKYGVNIVPVNFYSNVPSIEDIKNSYEYEKDAPPPYLNEEIFDKATLQKTLADLAEFSMEFNPDVEGDEETCDRFFWKNSQYSYTDAMAYYCLIRRLRPENVVEIGSGFSTLIALEAAQKNGKGAVWCIEPFPRPFIEKKAREKQLTLIKKKAQEIYPSYLNDLMQDGDILFIDSTHTVKTGSDCLHIYLRLLPQIKRDIFVHVHDIFLPQGMPAHWLLDLQLFWTEQYLLLAFLIDNPKAKVLFGTVYNMLYHEEEMKALMHDRFRPGGGCVWFEYKGKKRIDRD